MQPWPAPEVPRLPGEAPPLLLWDSSSRALRPAATGSRATMYVCGITPYDSTHLGHAATYVAFDTLRRAWQDGGVTVEHCQNVTDVDDPLLERAARDGVDWAELAARETARFDRDMVALRVLPPTWYVGATEAIPEIVELVGELRDRGAAYELAGDLYFPVAAAPAFGSVAGLDSRAMLTLSAERGGDPGRPGKKDPLDSLLWLAARAGEPAWDSPFGPGRPGWHVECAAIGLRRLGPAIDVLGGGSDLAFPHHEMGAAQAAVATGVEPYAGAFVHAGMVGLAGEKMSKSRGNLVFVSRVLAQGADPAALRLALLAHHYRGDWDWTPDQLPAAAARLAAWRAAVSRPHGAPAVALLTEVRRRLADDLDTPGALAAVDRWSGTTGDDAAAPELARDLVDALLGVRL
jgi:L-cysteine:1D-myo-inositol 2-amino-2-deoxy-alpha-D-glucopyranoside ligase